MFERRRQLGTPTTSTVCFVMTMSLLSFVICPSMCWPVRFASTRVRRGCRQLIARRAVSAPARRGIRRRQELLLTHTRTLSFGVWCGPCPPLHLRTLLRADPRTRRFALTAEPNGTERRQVRVRGSLRVRRVEGAHRLLVRWSGEVTQVQIDPSFPAMVCLLGRVTAGSPALLEWLVQQEGRTLRFPGGPRVANLVGRASDAGHRRLARCRRDDGGGRRR